MSLERLQRYGVSLIDAIRESTAEYGMEQAIKNGFYIELEDFAGNGVVPSDYWLTRNLNEKYSIVESLLIDIYNKEESQ